MLPRPPITTTAKASTISSMPISLMAAVAGMTSAPPSVPSMVPSVKTRTYIHRMSTPRASAISRLSAEARMIRPKAVRVRSQPMPTAMARLAAITIRL
jgi:hypothetical protein